MKLDAVFFNLIPGVNRNAARLDLQLAFASEACQYGASHKNIPSALHSEKHNTNHREAEREREAFSSAVLHSLLLWHTFTLL